MNEWMNEWMNELNHCRWQGFHYSLIKGNKVLLSLEQRQFWNKQINHVSRDRSYCNWSIKMARIIGFGSTSVVNSWQRLGLLPFWVYVKVGYSFKQKHIRQEKYLPEKFQKRLPQVWIASVFAPSSAVSCSPCKAFLGALPSPQAMEVE